MAHSITSFLKAGKEVERLTAALTESEKQIAELREENAALLEANKTLSEQNDKLNEQASVLVVPDVTKLTADLEIAQHNLKAMQAQHKSEMKAAQEDADKRVAAARIEGQAAGEASAKEIAATQTRTTLASLGVKPLEIKKDGTEETAVKAADNSTLFGLAKVKAAIKAQLTAPK